jgi:5-formyltetrahydrofolate cyclo-ligase
VNAPGPDVAQAKNDLRAALISARRQRPDAVRLVAARANAEHLRALLSGAKIVCGYLPLGSEPLRVELLDELVADGCTVLVPVVVTDAPLDWCTYPCPTVPGAFGIAEPTGPRLGPGAIKTAEAILVPALAVDRSGSRLGRGGGHYDRTLALLPTRGSAGGPEQGDDDRRAVEVVAVLFDDEIVDAVPTDTHDRAVNSVVRPSHGIHRFRS